jgi:hypothetical protein
MDEVLAKALVRQPTPIEWSESDQPAPVAAEEGVPEPVRTH